MHIRTKYLLIGIFFILFILFLIPIVFGIKNGFEFNGPTDREIFYKLVAYDYNRPELCELISPNSQNRAAFVARGDQANYTQSKCFYDIALKYSDIKLCDQVRELSMPIFLDGSNISKKSCIKDVNDLKNKDITPKFPDYIAQYMIELGYNEEPQPGSGFSQQIIYKHVYDVIRDGTEFERKEFLQRLFNSIEKDKK